MKKLWITLISLASALILAIILCYIFIATIIGSILTSSFGTKTTVSNAALMPNFLKLWHIHVSNPPPGKDPNALTIGRLKIETPMIRFFKDDVVIDLISLDDLNLYIEVLPGNGQITNWDKIVNQPSSKPSPPPSKSNKHTTIKELSINNITVKYTDEKGKTSVTKIDNLTFKNLSTKEGNITAQIAKAILLKMIFNVQNVVKFPLKLSKESVNDTFNKGIKPLENIIQIRKPGSLKKE